VPLLRILKNSRALSAGSVTRFVPVTFVLSCHSVRFVDAHTSVVKLPGTLAVSSQRSVTARGGGGLKIATSEKYRSPASEPTNTAAAVPSCTTGLPSLVGSGAAFNHFFMLSATVLESSAPLLSRRRC